MSRDGEFLEYVAAHRGRMLRTARLLAGGDHHWAEDLVQTALTKLYVQLGIHVPGNTAVELGDRGQVHEVLPRGRVAPAP
jgi:DNA-directed RNA polymerase specialized sigma24 family protein